MIKCICVDDTNRPEDFPLEKWIKKDNVYNITHVYYHINQGVQGVELSEIDLSDCEPYQSFKLKRFAIPLEDKENKSLGGIRALLWIKEAMYDFPKYFYNRVRNRTEYICIGWADSRRRNIYQRLEKEGFLFMVDNGNKILMKKL